jgi:hypothetical protein
VFKEIFDRQQAEFSARQLALINAMGQKFEVLIAKAIQTPGVNYGKPPFIVDDGAMALLLVAGDGKWSRLPSDLVLSEEMVQQGYDAFYSVPVIGFGSIRLIPANPDFPFPDADSTTETSAEDDSQFFHPLEALFDVYAQRVLPLTQESVVRKLAGMKGPLQRLCNENALSFKDVLQTPALKDSVIAIFESALSQAGETAAQEIKDGGEKSSDQIDFNH